MFFGDIAAATERKTRKQTTAASNANTSGEDSRLRRKKAPDNDEKDNIHFSHIADTIPRDVLMDFLRTCSEMLLDETNMREIINESVTERIGLDTAAVEFQRDVLENNFHIERNFGCKYLSTLGARCPDDKELIDASKDFMLTCLKSFIATLKLRSKMYKKGVIDPPKPKSNFTMITYMEFFDGCNALMVLPETKAELKKIFEETGQPPNKRVIEMQRNLIKLLGYDSDHGVENLNKMNERFPNEYRLHMKMQSFGIAAQLACQEAMMTDEQREAFFAKIPPLMHHFPHMHVLQERMAAMQSQQAHGVHSQSMPEPKDARERAEAIEVLKKSGILNLVSSPEGRTQLQGLAGRVSSSQQKMTDEVKEWDEERKLTFFENFSEHPLLQILQEAGEDPMKKIAAFITMGDSDLDAAMTLMVIASENNGALQEKIKERFAQTTPSSSSGSTSGQDQVKQDVVSTLNALSHFNQRFAAASSAFGNRQHQQHQMNSNMHHNHSHDHEGNCQMHPPKPQQDVSHGKADKMQR